MTAKKTHSKFNDLHPNVQTIDSHRLENVSHFAMRITLFSLLMSTTRVLYSMRHSKLCWIIWLY